VSFLENVEKSMVVPDRPQMTI